MEENGVTVEEYTGARDVDKPLPWDFIDFGVTKKYMLKEYEKALKEEITEPCKRKCNGCGAKRMGECRMYSEEEKK